MEHIDIAEKFLKRRAYVSLVLGKVCTNLLNPGFFLCPVKTCMALVKLNGFCYFLQFFRHISQHAAQENTITGYCKKILARNNHLTQRGRAWVEVVNLDREINDLNNKEELAIDSTIGGVFYANAAIGDFKGKHMMVNVDILSKIIDRAPDALDNLPKSGSCSQPGIDFFLRKSKSKKKVGNNSGNGSQKRSDEREEDIGSDGESESESECESESEITIVTKSKSLEDVSSGKKNDVDRKRKQGEEMKKKASGKSVVAGAGKVLKTKRVVVPDDDSENEEDGL